MADLEPEEPYVKPDDGALGCCAFVALVGVFAVITVALVWALKR